MKKLMIVILILMVSIPVFSDSVRVCHNDSYEYYKYAKVELYDNYYKLVPQSGYDHLRVYSRPCEWCDIDVVYIPIRDIINISSDNSSKIV